MKGTRYRPARRWRKSTGPDDVARTSRPVMAITGEARVSNAAAMVKSKQRRIGESTQGLASDDGSRIFETRWMCCVLPERTMTSALSSKNGGTEGAADIRMFPTKDKIYHPVICIDPAFTYSPIPTSWGCKAVPDWLDSAKGTFLSPFECVNYVLRRFVGCRPIGFGFMRDDLRSFYAR